VHRSSHHRLVEGSLLHGLLHQLVGLESTLIRVDLVEPLLVLVGVLLLGARDLCISHTTAEGTSCPRVLLHVGDDVRSSDGLCKGLAFRMELILVQGGGWLLQARCWPWEDVSADVVSGTRTS